MSFKRANEVAGSLSRKHFRSDEDGAPARLPSHRPAEAPFYPDAIEMWVIDKYDGTKCLVPELVLGCRHWRIGDPNVEFCYRCSGNDDLIGCRTCKRSYHRNCLIPPLPQNADHLHFHCPTCTERGWHLEPPTDILPYVQEIPDVGMRHFSQGPAIGDKPIAGANTAKVIAEDGPRVLHDNKTSDLRELTAPLAKNKRRSRYQTVSDDVDQAMTTIYRELESSVELRNLVSTLQDKITELEQNQRIQEGRLALEREGFDRSNRDSVGLRAQLADLKAANESLLSQNQELKAQLEEIKYASDTQAREQDKMKAKMRELLGD